MFKNLVRSEKYLITAVLYLPKNMDTKMVSIPVFGRWYRNAR